MPNYRLLLSFGLLIICLSASAQQNKPLDSLRSLVQEFAQDSLSNNQKELKTIKKYLREAKLSKSNTDIIYAYQQMAATYYRTGNVNLSLHYYKLYVLELEQETGYEKFRQRQFEKNLYENEIRALTIEIERLEQENIILISSKDEYFKLNYWIYLGLRVILAIGAVILLGWLFIKYKKPKKQQIIVAKSSSTQTLTEVLTTTKEQLAKAETELDLSDILVQQIITQPDNSFHANKSLRKKFLIHQPKMMAGGNGLYMASAKQKTLVAVFDTPLYGAAGGLLASRVYKLLDDLIKNHNILSPSLILNQIEINILNVFPAGVPFTEGIDMAICLYDASLKTITFSGANMDLFIVHRGLQNKLMGTARSLLKTKEYAEYFNSEIEVSRGKNFYLCTNGFWQQKGGYDHKPFGKSAFEKAIEALSSQPIIEHKQVLDKILSDWKGGNEQDDDILVLGFGF